MYHYDVHTVRHLYIRIVIKADPLEMANAITPSSYTRCPEDVNR